MKRLFRIMVRVVVVLISLPIVFLVSMYIYGKYLMHGVETRKVEFSAYQEGASTSGNGFGGDVGFEVFDTKLISKKYYWIDDIHLLVEAKKNLRTPDAPVGKLVLNSQTQSLKPLALDGYLLNFYGGYVLEGRFSETEISEDGKKKMEHFRSRLKELENAWVLEVTVKVEDVIGSPPARYEFGLSFDTKPKFSLQRELRTKNDVPEHRIRYLSEWGWIMRTPFSGSVEPTQTVPEMGFFDIGGEVYADQPGRKVADPLNLAPNEFDHLVVTYIDFLDKYWIANPYYGARRGAIPFMGFLERDGSFRESAWPAEWLDYSPIPLPTRKGVFWGGQDFRLQKRGRGTTGVFLRSYDGQVYKLMHGDIASPAVSKDGCRIAVFNQLRADDMETTLKLANVCTATMDGRALRDDDYQFE